MKKLLICLVILLSLLLTSCYSYKDINRVIFVTAFILDIDEDDQYSMYVEAFHSYRSNQTNSEQGERLFFQAKADSVYDSVREFNHKASYKLDYTQNKVIIITERAAKKGIMPLLDILERNQELILRSHMLILDKTPEELIKLDIKQNEYIGMHLYELMDNPFLSKQYQLDRTNQYLNYRLMDGKTHVLSILDIEENSISNSIEVIEGAIIKDDRMVNRLSSSDMKIYRLLQNRLDRELILVPHLYEKDYTIAVDTLKNQTKTDLEYDGEKIILKKKIEMRTIFAETQRPLNFNMENKEKIERLVEEVVKDNCEKLFNKMKEENYDIFDVAELMERKYPNVEVENPLAITELQLEVENYLEGSTNITRFR